ncbi:hypothetical protein ACGF5F_13295 [Streptomyces sp. NPDC047821]|uniref:hypothetical protein n=1 Tax=Streptomyces sp. NPDC047821 TaxID=3365488 RepID=UPI00371C519B
MRGNTCGARGSWVAVLVTGGLLAGCSAQAADGGTPRRAGASAHTTSPHAPVPPPGGSTTAPVFTPDASLVPRTAEDGQKLVESVVPAPGDWGRGFVAQDPAVSRPGTWAVLDDGCRWGREQAPRGVLAGLSRYSVLPADGSRGAVKVTAAATVHASALGADEQLSTALEEVLRCPEQRPRADALITGLNSLGTPFGAREQEHADDSVLEAGLYVEKGGAAQPYRWMVARLGTVVVAVSVTGGKGHTEQELQQRGADALGRMLARVQQHLKGK